MSFDSVFGVMGRAALRLVRIFLGFGFFAVAPQQRLTDRAADPMRSAAV